MADAKLTTINTSNPLTTFDGDELIYFTDDPSGTPADAAGTVDNLLATQHDHTLSDISDVTATSTELNYVDGVTSAIQTQLDAKVDESITVNGNALSSNVTLDIDDVAPTQTGNSGKVLKTDGTNATWQAESGGTSDLDDLTDVTIDTPTSGQVLKYNGSTWVNDTDSTGEAGAITLGDATDVTITDVADNEVLAYDSTSSEWINQTPAEAGLAAASHTHTESDITDLGSYIESLSDLGVTATVTELNYTDGVTSAIQTQLDGKVDENSAITGATKTKITYDAKGLVTAGADATFDDFSDGTTNKAFTSTLKTKLDGIETAADVTDATNVDAAGAVMNSDTTTASMSFVVDEDDMTSDSATKVPTQQSVKAYVDAEVAGAGGGGSIDLTKLRIFTLDPEINSALILATGANTTKTQSRGATVSTSAADGSAGFQMNINTFSDHDPVDAFDSVLVGRSFIRKRPVNSVVFYVYFYSAGLSSTGADTSKGLGIRSNGSTLLARNGNGTSETTTDIGASFTANSNENKLVEIVHTPGTNDKFYLANSLVATHTTNLPSGDAVGTNVGWVNIRMLSASTAADVTLGSQSLIQQLP